MCEFSENQRSDVHTLLMRINDFLPLIFFTSLDLIPCNTAQEISAQCHGPIVNFMKINAVKTTFSLKAVNEFCPFLNFSSDWDKVQYRRCSQTCIPCQSSCLHRASVVSKTLFIIPADAHYYKMSGQVL
jgi:hypothetical protein